MKTRIVEVTNNNLNWGKFLVGILDTEWERKALVEGTPSDLPLLGIIRLTPFHVWVLDLQTGEGGNFYIVPGGSAKADLDKHRIWVCPMFEPFLDWLYKTWRQDGPRGLDSLPEVLNLPDAVKNFSLAGYRRPGPQPEAC